MLGYPDVQSFRYFRQVGEGVQTQITTNYNNVSFGPHLIYRGVQSFSPKETKTFLRGIIFVKGSSSAYTYGNL